MLENKEQTYNEEKEVNTYSPKPLEPLPFDPDYQDGMDETSPDGLMSIPELEDAFEKDRHHEPLPNDCEHLTVPLIECQEYLTGGHGIKERAISPQSKRRRVSPDGDLEQQQLPRIDQESAGLDPPTATSIATSTTMDEDPDPDSPSFSDIDLFMDSEDEVSLIRNAGPSARRISLSVTRESQATVKITYPATGLNATSNMQAADAPALSISQVPQGSVDFSSTKRTLSPTNIVSQVSHSDPSAGFSVSSLSLSSFAAMSLSLNLDNDMSIAASDNLTAPSSFSAVNMEDVVMTDQFNDSQVTSVPEAGDVSTTHEPRSAFFQVEPDEQPSLSSQNTSGYGLADKHSATDAAVASAPSISEQPIMPAPKPTDRITGEYGFVDKHLANIASVHSSDDGSPLVNQELASASLPAADIPALRDADLESTPTEASAQDQTHIFSPLAPTGQNPKLVSPSLFSLSGFQVTPNTKTCPLCNKTYKHHGYLVNQITSANVNAKHQSQPLLPKFPLLSKKAQAPTTTLAPSVASRTGKGATLRTTKLNLMPQHPLRRYTLSSSCLPFQKHIPGLWFCQIVRRAIKWGGQSAQPVGPQFRQETGFIGILTILAKFCGHRAFTTMLIKCRICSGHHRHQMHPIRVKAHPTSRFLLHSPYLQLHLYQRTQNLLFHHPFSLAGR